MQRDSTSCAHDHGPALAQLGRDADLYIVEATALRTGTDREQSPSRSRGDVQRRDLLAEEDLVVHLG